MASIFKLLIYLLLIVTTISCDVSERETELDIPYKGDFLVLNGFISQGEGIRLVVQKTVSHSCRNCSDSVSNAVVSLYENGVYQFDLITDDGYNYYSPSSFSPSIDKEYHIKAEADKMPTAISSLVKLMPIVSIDTAYLETTENPYKMKAHYSFIDIQLERNQYIASISSGEEDGIFWCDHASFDFVIGDEVAKDGHLEGELIYFLDSEHGEANIILRHLSPPLAQYLYSRNENFFSEDDPFGEYPIPVYSNISNGYGFFGSYAKDRYNIRF